MNRIHVTTTLDDNQEPTGPHAAEITFSQIAKESAWGQSMLAAFEVEILRGFSFTNDDGSTTYRLELDNEKAKQLKQALTLAFFPPASN